MNKLNLTKEFSAMVKQLSIEQLVEAILISYKDDPDARSKISSHTFNTACEHLDWMLASAMDVK